MKKKIFALFFTLLLSLSLLFCGCEPSDSMFPEDTSEAATDADFTRELLRLETLIAELTAAQTGDQKKNREEIDRLEQELAALRAQIGKTESTDTEDTETQTAPPLSSSEFLYIRQGSNAVLTGYTGDAEFLVLPSSIDGYTLTEIADNAFESTTLRSVVIPNTVTKIGWFAFQGCSSLQSVTVPDTVTAIGYAAFPGALSSFTLYCPANSFAQKYAESYGISYALI